MTQIMCGVDVGSETLDARIGQDGAWQQFARDADGIAEAGDAFRERQEATQDIHMQHRPTSDLDEIFRARDGAGQNCQQHFGRG